MAEYIDRESAKRNILSLTVYDNEHEIKDAVKSARYREDQWIGGIYDALVSLNEVYAADVVEVVRCKDCKHYNNKRTFYDDDVCEILYYCDGVHRTACERDFCSYGERREDGQSDH